jgi:hypothetical protein
MRFDGLHVCCRVANERPLSDSSSCFACVTSNSQPYRPPGPVTGITTCNLNNELVKQLTRDRFCVFV